MSTCTGNYEQVVVLLGQPRRSLKSGSPSSHLVVLGARHSRQHRSPTELSPQSLSRTIRIFSSALDCRLLARRICLIASVATASSSFFPCPLLLGREPRITSSDANACLISCHRKPEIPASFKRLRHPPSTLSNRPPLGHLETTPFDICAR